MLQSCPEGQRVGNEVEVESVRCEVGRGSALTRRVETLEGSKLEAAAAARQQPPGE